MEFVRDQVSKMGFRWDFERRLAVLQEKVRLRQKRIYFTVIKLAHEENVSQGYETLGGEYFSTDDFSLDDIFARFMGNMEEDDDRDYKTFKRLDKKWFAGKLQCPWHHTIVFKDIAELGHQKTIEKLRKQRAKRELIEELHQIDLDLLATAFKELRKWSGGKPKGWFLDIHQ